MPHGLRNAARSLALLGLLFLSIAPGVVHAADLSGIVRQEDGAPAGAGWRVVVQSIDASKATVTFTNANGAFTLRELAEGRTGITVYPPAVGEAISDPRAGRMVTLSGGRTADIVLTLAPEGAGTGTFNFAYYVGEYFDNAPTEETSDAVNLPAQGTVNNINMQLGTGGGSLSGRVTQDAGGAGVSGLIVTAFGIDSDTFSFDRTDEDGYYRVTGIPADNFVVTAGLAFGDPQSIYVGEYWNNSYSGALASLVEVTEGSDTPNINFSLGLGATISGRVTDEASGNGISNALVALYENTLNISAIELTNEEGFYTVRRLAPGTWKVSANSGDNHLSEFWNDKPSLDAADGVTVTSGSTTPNINFALTNGARVTGTVTDQVTLAPLENLLVIVERSSDGLSRVAITDEAGNYEAMALPAGTYTAYVPEIGEWWDNQSSEENATTFSVAQGQTVANINFSGILLVADCPLDPQQVGSVAGTVLDAELEPIADATVGLYMDVLGNLFQIGQATTDINGNYLIDCVSAGDYFVQATAEYTPWLSEWYNNATEENPDAITVEATQLTDNIDFQLARGGTINGRITGPLGVGLAGVEVHARNRDTENSTTDITDVDGNYSISVGADGGLPGGMYTVWSDGKSTADPTLIPVVLASFTAVAVDGTVRLEWTTSREAWHAGFHVERGAAPDGASVRISSRLITNGPAYRFVDEAPLAGDAWYWLVSVDRDGRTERLGPLAVGTGTPAVSRLLGPAVNPSRETASIRWEMARPGRLTLQVFDAAGRWVTTLVDDVRPAGAGAVQWDGNTASGEEAAAGLYFLRFATADGQERGRLALVR
ncbi:MAG TPA: carboxypeptidase regulatory-like domain-containing protein [Candidatus Eisenbacteria bacterium]